MEWGHLNVSYYAGTKSLMAYFFSRLTKKLGYGFVLCSLKCIYDTLRTPEKNV